MGDNTGFVVLTGHGVLNVKFLHWKLLWVSCAHIGTRTTYHDLQRKKCCITSTFMKNNPGYWKTHGKNSLISHNLMEKILDITYTYGNKFCIPGTHILNNPGYYELTGKQSKLSCPYVNKATICGINMGSRHTYSVTIWETAWKQSSLCDNHTR